MNRPDIEGIEKRYLGFLPSSMGAYLEAQRFLALIAYIRHLEAANKRIEHETAFKCAWLAWEAFLAKRMPHLPICEEFGLNRDSLYAAKWEEIK